MTRQAGQARIAREIQGGDGAHGMQRNQAFAIAVLIGLAIFAGVSLLGRLRDGRCRIGGGGVRTAGFNCTYAPGTFPAWP